ncbi:MAG: hypothetical protein ACK496_02525, partial [Acidobacteriota bacterium]
MTLTRDAQRSVLRLILGGLLLFSGLPGLYSSLAEFGEMPELTGQVEANERALRLSVQPIEQKIQSIRNLAKVWSSKFGLQPPTDGPIADGWRDAASVGTNMVSLPWQSVVGPGIHDDASPNWIYTGAWTAATSLSGPHAGTLRYTTALNATASIQFSGHAFKIRYTRNQYRGKIAIYVDGVKVTDVDAFNATLAWQAVYHQTGLTNGNHTLEIRHGGGPAGSIIDIDALEVISPPTPVGVGTYDDNNYNWTYSGNWSTASGLTGPYSGTLQFTANLNATASIQINGSAFRLRYTRNQYRGILAVYVDGAKITEINAYLATTAWQGVFQRSGLASGIHTIEIRHGGGPAGSIIDIDALEVFAPPTPTPLGIGLYDDTHPSWSLTGAWNNSIGLTGPYSGTLSQTNDLNATMSIQINGTSFRLLHSKNSASGTIVIYVDGVKVADINATQTNQMWQSTYEKSGLTSGVHTIEIRHGGAAGRVIDIDALEVYEPPSPVGVGIYDDTNSNWTYTGTWSAANGLTGPHNGTLKYSSDLNAKAYISFNGSAFRLRYTTNQYRGIILIHLDGVKVGEINANGKTLAWQSVFQRTGLTNGVHAVQISHGGGAPGSIIDIDAFEVFVAPPVSALGVGVYDDTHPNWLYSSMWMTTTSIVGPYAGSVTTTDVIGAKASIQIIGTAFRLRFTRHANRGLLAIYVDGVKVADINANQSSLTWQALHSQSGLTNSIHSVEIIHGGGPNQIIDIDSLEVFVPPLPVKAGVYDDTNANWSYTGNWTSASALTGPFNGTLRFSSDLTATASMLIDGTTFRLRFTRNQYRGTLGIYVDGAKVADVNANQSTLTWQAVYQRTGLANGVHSIEIRHGGGAPGSIIDIDSLEVFTASPVGVGVYDDTNLNWNYSGNWTMSDNLSGPQGGTITTTADLSATASIQMNGTAFRLRFTRNSNRGILAVYIDGVKQADLNANQASLSWQAIYQKTGLSIGVHTIEIRHGGGAPANLIDIDSLEVYQPPVPVGTGLYDDTSSNWIYAGSWTSASGLTGPHNGTIRHTTDLSATASIQINA